MYIAPNVPTMESGTATLGMTVAESFPRNRKITITTSATVSTSSNCTSWTDARMVVVRSVSTCTSTPAGSDAVSCGRRLVMRSTTPMMLAPGWRWMLTSTAGSAFIHAACCTFSASSITSATSMTRTGASLRYAMTRPR